MLPVSVKNLMMKMRWLIGLVIGGIVGLIVNVILGFGCGLVIGFFTDRFSTGSLARESALMLAWVFPTVLIGTYGPFLGALVGLVSSYLKSWRNVVFMALLVGLAQAFLISLQLFEPPTSAWVVYASLAVTSMLAAGLSTYFVVSRLRRENSDRKISDEGSGTNK
ncbi:hypothetical protein TFLX_04200 [Thermoflexales bacterium]|nr:hypothetical protein TFLX_04200 [Thermoflexales bacterium]